MSWRRGSRESESSVLGLLLQNEALCVSASSRLRDHAEPFTAYINAPDGRDEVRECMLYTRHGLLLPVIPLGGEDERDIKQILLGLSPAVHSVMGFGSWVRRIESLMPLPPTTGVEYNLMTLEESGVTPPAAPLSSPVIHRASPADADALFPLQKGYEKEEVVINPHLFNELQCGRLLKKNLREEMIFFAEKDGKPVAKAGTNARGFGVDQIGGVYTAPEERGKGYAEAVMRVLLTFIFEEKHGACLFVKKKNAAANMLYKKLGFKTVGDFLINYYGIEL